MTLAPESEARPVPEGYVRLTIDGIEVEAPKGELLIRTAERMGITIPRFCDHPLLDPAGACRQCLVEVEMNGRAMPKPQASCTMTVADGMVVKTQNSSPVADKAQQGVMELLLINHPLDCPICDKSGECKLQDYTHAEGRRHGRSIEPKRVLGQDGSVLLGLDEPGVRIVVGAKGIRRGRGVESGRAVLQGQAHAGQLRLDLVDRLLAEVADIEQVGFAAGDQLTHGVDALALQAVVRPDGQLQVLDRQRHVRGQLRVDRRRADLVLEPVRGGHPDGRARELHRSAHRSQRHPVARPRDLDDRGAFSVTRRKEHPILANEQRLRFPLLSDFNKEVIRAYDVYNPDMIGLKGIAKRAVFVIDRAGTVRYREVLEDARNEPNYDKLNGALAGL